MEWPLSMCMPLPLISRTLKASELRSHATLLGTIQSIMNEEQHNNHICDRWSHYGRYRDSLLIYWVPTQQSRRKCMCHYSSLPTISNILCNQAYHLSNPFLFLSFFSALPFPCLKSLGYYKYCVNSQSKETRMDSIFFLVIDYVSLVLFEILKSIKSLVSYYLWIILKGQSSTNKYYPQIPSIKRLNRDL